MSFERGEGESRPDTGGEAGRIVVFPDRSRLERWEPYVSEVVVARYFSVTGRTVRRWRIAGMPSYAIGGCRRFRLSECEAWHAGRGSA